MFFFFKQKTAYEMRISDWSSDVCSSDLLALVAQSQREADRQLQALEQRQERLNQELRDLNAPDPDNVERLAGDSAALQEQLEEIGRASCRERVCQYV